MSTTLVGKLHACNALLYLHVCCCRTAVAGVIGAYSNNGIGIAGVSWRINLLSCKVMQSRTVGGSIDWFALETDVIKCIK